jgi:hypothetical protein
MTHPDRKYEAPLVILVIKEPMWMLVHISEQQGRENRLCSPISCPSGMEIYYANVVRCPFSE